MNTKTQALSHSLIEEMLYALALPNTSFTRRLIWTFFGKVFSRLAEIGATFDDILGESGLQEASEWVAAHFANQITAEGVRHIPATGPLVIASNHPGTIDALVLFSKIPRKDLKCFSSYIPFLEKLPNFHDRLIFASKTSTSNRARSALSAVKHLREGGSLLYFGAGHLEPDPAVMKGCPEMMDHWLGGLELFFRHVPNLQISPAIVSGVISSKWANSRVRFLRRKPVDRIRLVNFAQVISQLFFPGRLKVSPSVSFAPAYQKGDLANLHSGNGLSKRIISKAKHQLEVHCNHFSGTF